MSRAFHRDAPLLICDEPTANLDARAEHDELMAVDGLYAQLFTLQASAYQSS